MIEFFVLLVSPKTYTPPGVSKSPVTSDVGCHTAGKVKLGGGTQVAPGRSFALYVDPKTEPALAFVCRSCQQRTFEFMSAKSSGSGDFTEDAWAPPPHARRNRSGSAKLFRLASSAVSWESTALVAARRRRSSTKSSRIVASQSLRLPLA